MYIQYVYPFYFIEEKNVALCMRNGESRSNHTLVEGSDNLWLIIATKNNKKMTTSLNDPQTLWGSFGVTVKQLSIPLLDEELPTPIWLSFWDNQIKFLITLHVGTTILHVGTTVHVTVLYIATTTVYVGTTNSSSLL